MQVVFVGIIIGLMLAVSLYSFFRWRELKASCDATLADYESRQTYLEEQIKELEKYKDIPGIVEKSRKLKEEIELRISQANKKAENIVNEARVEARKVHFQEIEDAELHLNEVKTNTVNMLHDLSIKRETILQEAKEQAKNIVEDAKRKSLKTLEDADAQLRNSIVYCKDMREKSEKEILKINDKAFAAMNKYEYFEKAAQAMKNVVEGYSDNYMNIISSVVDEMADEFGYHEAGLNLLTARKRTKQLLDMRMAATSDYVEVGRKEFAKNFVLDAFNGKVDSILSRAKESNYGKLEQEMKDAFILVNVNGKGFRNSRITEDYFESRLDELKWICVVQGIKVRQKEEQKAIREQIRDEQKAKKEFETALRQAKKQEELIEKALLKARREFELASLEQKNSLQLKIDELEAKLTETEGYIKRTQSLAEQTKQGNVYIISNVGSFGENIYKIGLTRRLNPMDRINELGDASVPFRFDCHAIIPSEDAPALEYLLHQKLLNKQVNKINRRKEFFNLMLTEIRDIVEGMKINVQWSMIAEASEYRETLEINRKLEQDTNFRKQWIENQLRLKPEFTFDEDEEMQLMHDGNNNG